MFFHATVNHAIVSLCSSVNLEVPVKIKSAIVLYVTSCICFVHTIVHVRDSSSGSICSVESVAVALTLDFVAGPGGVNCGARFTVFCSVSLVITSDGRAHYTL